MFLVGILQAVGITLFISFYNVFLRVAVQEWHIEPVVFTSVCLMVSAFILSFCAGPGRLVKETLKSPATWLYSLVLIGAYVVDVYVMHYISATEASFFSRLTIPLSMLVAWLVLRRKPQKSDMIGLSLVIFSLGWLVVLQPSALLGAILFTVVLSALFQTFQFVIAETHKEAVAASEKGTIRDKARVVGFVTFVSSGVFLILTFVASLFKQQLPLNAQLEAFIPNPELFIHPPTVWAALFYGALILPFIRYLKWAASYNMKAENLFVFMAFIPIATLLMERGAALLMDIPSNSNVFEGARGQSLMAISILMTLGAGLTAFLRVRGELNKVSGENLWEILKNAFAIKGSMAIQHATNALDDYEVIAAALEHTGGDKEKAAELLNMPLDTLIVLYEGKGKLALASHASQEVARRYRTHVASRDPLTGLLNRSGFMGEVKKALAEEGVTSLLFIDLNKFKPVNDTYGHEAGDYILQGVAERLTEMFPAPNHITRLGGDEYCILLPSISKAEAKKCMTKLKKEIEKPFKLDGVKEPVGISASIGLATAPEDTTSPEVLLKAADEGMYREKKER